MTKFNDIGAPLDVISSVWQQSDQIVAVARYQASGFAYQRMVAKPCHVVPKEPTHALLLRFWQPWFINDDSPPPVAEKPAEKAEKATPTHAAAGTSKSPKKAKAAKQASKLPAEEPKTAKEKATNKSSARAPVGPSKSPKKAKAAKQASKLPAEEPKTAKEKATNKSSARAPVGSSAVPKTPKEAAAGGSKAAPAAAPSTAT
eukprot:jgi/Tetstr1/443580/TSEL_031579.t1